MPTYSDAISDNDFTSPQKPTLKKPNRPREKQFWDAEPGDAGTEGWSDNPNDPTGAQLGSGDANVVVTPTRQTATNAKWTEYLKFTNEVTSNESKDTEAFIIRIRELQTKGLPIERLLTAAIGINAEGGEFLEIVKKIAFQGKEFNAAEKEHLKVELGDVLWYVAQACIALDLSLDDVIARNISKLAARYPEGHFNSYFSENRRIDDI
tara:strand:- start:4 stop:627 length:624 start_codon:yes stop_codon:yes gene_type:complete